MFETVTVNGKDVVVLIDTSDSGYMTGKMEVAQKLNLVLHDVTHLNLKLEHVSDTVQVKYSSYLNHMKIKDREWGLVTYVVDDADSDVSVGVAAIRGAIIHLYHDGSHEMLLSGKLDLEEEERTLFHEN